MKQYKNDTSDKSLSETLIILADIMYAMMGGCALIIFYVIGSFRVLQLYM